MPGKKNETGKISLVEELVTNGKEVETEIEGSGTANSINEFFSNIGPELAKNYSDP